MSVLCARLSSALWGAIMTAGVACATVLFQEDEAHLVFGQAHFQVVDVVIDQHNVIRTYNDDAIIRADRGVGQAGQRLCRQL